MEYRAVAKEDPEKDLTHWKYIKRERVNGKWRYYYSELKRKENELRKQYDDALTLSKKDYDKMPDEDKQKWNKEMDDFDAEMQKIRDDLKNSFKDSMIEESLYNKRNIDSGRLFVEQMLLPERI